MNACVVVCTLLAALVVAGIDSAEETRWLRQLAIRLGTILALAAFGILLVLVLQPCPSVP